MQRKQGHTSDNAERSSTEAGIRLLAIASLRIITGLLVQTTYSCGLRFSTLVGFASGPAGWRPRLDPSFTRYEDH